MNEILLNNKSYLKILYAFISTVIITSGSFAQSCEGYFPMSKGTIMETTSYNDKNKPQSVSTVTIQSVENKGDVVLLSLHSEVNDEKGKNIASSDYDARCEKGSFSLSLKSIVGYEIHSVQYVSKGNGVIKTESFKGDKMKGYTLLTKLVK